MLIFIDLLIWILIQNNTKYLHTATKKWSHNLYPHLKTTQLPVHNVIIHSTINTLKIILPDDINHVETILQHDKNFQTAKKIYKPFPTQSTQLVYEYLSLMYKFYKKHHQKMPYIIIVLGVHSYLDFIIMLNKEYSTMMCTDIFVRNHIAEFVIDANNDHCNFLIDRNCLRYFLILALAHMCTSYYADFLMGMLTIPSKMPYQNISLNMQKHQGMPSIVSDMHWMTICVGKTPI